MVASPTLQAISWIESFATVEIDDWPPSSTALQGTLIVNNRPAASLVGLPSLRAAPLPSSPPSVWVPATVSIDRRLLAYTNGPDLPEQLFIVDAAGLRQETPAWPRFRGWMPIGWLDNHRLLLSEYWLFDGSAYLYDLHTGELTLVPPPFPVVNEDGEFRGGEPRDLPIAYYNRDLDRVVISRYSEDAPNRHTIELRSAPDGQLIWKADSKGEDPVWDPEGQRFAVILRSEIHDGDDYCTTLALVSQDGQPTYLDDCAWHAASWSPDGNSIAAWSGGESPDCPGGISSTTLMLLNVKNRHKKSLRICNDQSQAGIPMNQQPIWSPDGKFIVINRYDYQLEPVDSLLIDPASGMAYTIPRAKEVAGWMW